MFTPATTVVYEATSNSGIKVQGQKAAVMNTGLFKNKDFSFSKLGIGGLDRQLRIFLDGRFLCEFSRKVLWSDSGSNTSRVCCFTVRLVRVRL